MAQERLQKILARAGVGSRRACEALILAGHVSVDGRVVTELGTQADPAQAKIEVDGRPLVAEHFRYIMLHKPAGYLSGVDPRAGYPSWQELVKVPERLFAVGRLDHDSEGLLLLTNDGELANQLAHPRYEHAKTYLVQVEGLPNPRKIRRLQHGVMLDDGPTLPARVALLRQPPVAHLKGHPPVPHTCWLQITLREGRKRQVRRMVGLLGHPALRVIRTDLGPLHLGDLKPGHWRDLTPGEVQALQAAAAQVIRHQLRPDLERE
ncbi:MAG TPA: pseudouridine synthase, partial [Anaerolineae bacterium]